MATLVPAKHEAIARTCSLDAGAKHRARIASSTCVLMPNLQRREGGVMRIPGVQEEVSSECSLREFAVESGQALAEDRHLQLQLKITGGAQRR